MNFRITVLVHQSEYITDKKLGCCDSIRLFLQKFTVSVEGKRVSGLSAKERQRGVGGMMMLP